MNDKLSWCLNELSNNKKLKIKYHIINNAWREWCITNKILRYASIDFAQELNGMINDVAYYYNMSNNLITYEDIKKYDIYYKKVIDLIYTTIKNGYRGFIYYEKN